MPRVRVRVPAALRSFTSDRADVETEGETVGDALRQLVGEFSGLGRHLFAPNGGLRPYVGVYLNDRDVRSLERERTPLRDGDVLSIVPSITGGAEPSATSSPSFELGARGAERRETGLGSDSVRRYSRHLLLPEVGLRGQRRLRESKVLLVGAGGLGAPAGLYLAAAGVGEIGLVDFDRVDLSNLQRQVLYGTRDVGRPKLEAAKERLTDLNPEVVVRTFEEHLDRDNARRILSGYDVVVDGTDNFPTRYLVNDACVLLGKPNVYGSVYRFEGQASVFDARRGPCYRCLYPEPPPPGLVPSCAEGGVLGVLPGLVGMVQAIETLKRLLEIGDGLTGRLLLIDALEMRFRELKIDKNPDCPICGPHATQTDLIDYPAFCGIVDEAADADIPSVDPETLHERLTSGAARGERPTLLDVREPGEWEIAHLDGAVLIPRRQLPERVDQLAQARELVVYCKSGRRSADAVRYLRDLGFTNVRHLKGGLDAWVDRVDPSMPTY
jgi:molybdopterin/thiamine biosynthesis adenylyltransferase/rhodanese-related sulfurtransferase/molybdopterin converting factor small subunit